MTNRMLTEMEALKEKLEATWSDGDYGRIARNLEASAREFFSRIRVAHGSDVLDVACGTGQIAFPAARAGARVTGLDLAPNLIEQARAKAEAEGLDVRFDVGDAEELPYEDNSFDLVISLIGAMFAPRPERVAAEMRRVCRPGGRIVMGNWTPDGFIGSFFRIVGQYAPPPEMMPSPLLWGDESVVRDRLGRGSEKLRMTRRQYSFSYPFPPAQVVDHYEQFFGPIRQAMGRLDFLGRVALRKDLENLWKEHNQAADGTTHVEAEILEVVATRN